MLLRTLYSLDIFQISSHLNDILGTLQYKKILYFQHKIKSPFFNVKNYKAITLVVVPICVIAPFSTIQQYLHLAQ